MLTVSKVYHPIFRNGEHADKFRTEFPNVKINIPPISIEKDEITVAGEKEAVLKVTEYIKKSVKDMVSSHLVSQGFFLGVLAKTQFVQNAKTQFENTKTQFENAKTQFKNLKSPLFCNF